MGSPLKPDITPPEVEEAGVVTRRQAIRHDRRAVRAVDLTDEDIAAIEAAELASGFEHLNAEFDER